MAKARKFIITCAVTGSIHTPSMSPHLPITASEIADAAIGAAEAGAAVVHLHARNPKDGRPDQSPEAFAPFLKVIKQRSNCVINITTGGGMGMTVEQRVAPAATFKPEIASLNMGTMNFGLFPMLQRQKEFKYDWEKPYIEGTRAGMFKNTFADIEYILTTCANNGSRFEIECYDIGHLYTLRHFADRGVVKPPFFIQSVFGILGGIGPHPEDVLHMKRTADRLFGAEYHWSVWVRGATRCRSRPGGGDGRQRARRHGGLAVAGAGTPRQEQRRAGGECAQDHRGLGLEIASSNEAREMLSLKGGDKVAF
jgi:uncharacterized protein (DUF849 family)